MFTKSDIITIFRIIMIGRNATTTLMLVNKSGKYHLSQLSIEGKKALILIDDAETIFNHNMVGLFTGSSFLGWSI